MRRFIFLSDIIFPQSGAVSGYIKNLMILTHESFPNSEIIVISPQNKAETENPIFYRHIGVETTGKLKVISELIRILHILNISSEDIIFNFLTKPENQLFIYLCFHKRKKNFIAYFGELFNLSYFGVSIIGCIKYLRYTVGFYIRNSYSNAIVVSSYLQKHIKSKNVLRIPPMCDIKENSLNELNHKEWSNLKFIYPGSDAKKDRIERLLAVFSILSKKIEGIELHLTGIRNFNKTFPQVKESFLKENNIVVHKWLSSAKYHELLSQMDFCIIIRENNKISRANFPSKVPEVMKYGIIPIVSSVGDYTDIYLKDEINSFVVSGAEVSDFVDRIKVIMELDSSRLNSIHYESCRFALNNFAVDNWIEPYQAYIMKTFD